MTKLALAQGISARARTFAQVLAIQPRDLEFQSCNKCCHNCAPLGLLHRMQCVCVCVCGLMLVTLEVCVSMCLCCVSVCMYTDSRLFFCILHQINYKPYKSCSSSLPDSPWSAFTNLLILLLLSSFPSAVAINPVPPNNPLSTLLFFFEKN